jgi:putative endonuclease
MLLCRDGRLYTGVTTDIARRAKQHNDGRGARFTRAARPVRVVYLEEAEDRSSALKRELAIKKLSRSQKLHLLTSKLNRLRLEAEDS